MKEIWKDVKDYEGLYQVSNIGRIKSLSRFVNTYKKGRIKKEHILSIIDNGNGYCYVTLSKNNKHKNYFVHRLVASAFINNPNNYKEINHKDNNKKNNCVDNLEWCDRSYNVKYSYDKGYHIPSKNLLGKFGKEHPISKSVKQYDLQGNFIKEFESANLASKETNICYCSIKKCRNGKQKSAGGYIWL